MYSSASRREHRPRSASSLETRTRRDSMPTAGTAGGGSCRVAGDLDQGRACPASASRRGAGRSPYRGGRSVTRANRSPERGGRSPRAARSPSRGRRPSPRSGADPRSPPRSAQGRAAEAFGAASSTRRGRRRRDSASLPAGCSCHGLRSPSRRGGRSPSARRGRCSERDPAPAGWSRSRLGDSSRPARSRRGRSADCSTGRSGSPLR